MDIFREALSLLDVEPKIVHLMPPGIVFLSQEGVSVLHAMRHDHQHDIITVRDHHLVIIPDMDDEVPDAHGEGVIPPEFERLVVDLDGFGS